MLIFSWTCSAREDYSSATHHRVTFPQTVLTDRDTPNSFSQSFPISINITDDDIAEGLEVFKALIVGTSYSSRVRIGQHNIVNVNIIDDDSESFISFRHDIIGRYSVAFD